MKENENLSLNEFIFENKIFFIIVLKCFVAYWYMFVDRILVSRTVYKVFHFKSVVQSIKIIIIRHFTFSV